MHGKRPGAVAPNQRRPRAAVAPLPRTPGSIRPMLRTACARAVHEAVCEFTDSDGFGACHLYAVAGHSLLTGEKIRPTPSPQGGSLLIQPDPARPGHWFALDATGGGMGRGEFHAWLMAEDGTIVDFSARHFRRYAEELPIPGGALSRSIDPALIVLDRPEARTPWNRTDYLEYVWTTADRLPSWVRYRTDARASEALADHIAATLHGREMTQFRSLIRRKYLRAGLR
jgi:hypothetical protein